MPWFKVEIQGDGLEHVRTALNSADIPTMGPVFTGLGVFVALLASVAQKYIEQKSEGGGARERLRARRGRDRTVEGD